MIFKVIFDQTIKAYYSIVFAIVSLGYKGECDLRLPIGQTGGKEDKFIIYMKS